MTANHQCTFCSLMGTTMYFCAIRPPGTERVHLRTFCHPCSPFVTPPDVNFWKKKVLAKYISSRTCGGATNSTTSCRKKFSTESLRHRWSFKKVMSRIVISTPFSRTDLISSAFGGASIAASGHSMLTWGNHQRSVESAINASLAGGTSANSFSKGRPPGKPSVVVPSASLARRKSATSRGRDTLNMTMCSPGWKSTLITALVRKRADTCIGWPATSSNTNSSSSSPMAPPTLRCNATVIVPISDIRRGRGPPTPPFRAKSS
mmetsp:Transcript_1447/g.3903  ORF Transcript_1447/g.3903 Transcript_1447/m.3903 type:complete len:262 (-) Transcript_1447:213-998(-)